MSMAYSLVEEYPGAQMVFNTPTHISIVTIDLNFKIKRIISVIKLQYKYCCVEYAA